MKIRMSIDSSDLELNVRRDLVTTLTMPTVPLLSSMKLSNRCH